VHSGTELTWLTLENGGRLNKDEMCACVLLIFVELCLLLTVRDYVRDLRVLIVQVETLSTQCNRHLMTF